MNDSSGPHLTGLQENVFFRYFIFFLLIAFSWDLADLDLKVMSLLGDSRGFAFKNHPLLALWLHDRGKQLALVVFFGDGDMGLASGGALETVVKGSTRDGVDRGAGQFAVGEPDQTLQLDQLSLGA